MIDYERERNKYRPEVIKTLLIGEAPPSSGRTFFYVPQKLAIGKKIEDDTSLPSTIFNHYFDKRPESIEEYDKFLVELKQQGIFLIDILDEPKRIRNNQANEQYLITHIPKLRDKVRTMGIELAESEWIFLRARNTYEKYLNIELPIPKKIRWKDFRLTTHNPILCVNGDRKLPK